MKRAAGYVRVSQIGNRAGDSFLSPELQREKIEAWAAYRGATIVGWYIDLDAPASKGSPPRPQFERLMADAAEGAFDAVAVYRLTRFARSVADAARCYGELERLGVDLVSVTEDLDTTTSGGRLMRNVLFSLAEFEADRIGEEWRSVHANRRRRGLPHMPVRPYGYDVNGAVPVAIREEEAEAVRFAFHLRSQLLPINRVMGELERAGFQPYTPGGRWERTTVRRLLKNPIYAGLVLADGELVPGTFPAIIDEELWRTVQATWRNTPSGRFAPSTLLTGLLYCHACGGTLSAVNRRSGGYPIYRCRPAHGPCDGRVSIGQRPLDEYVESEFVGRLDPEKLPHRGQVPATRQVRDWTARERRLRHRAAELERALDTLADQWAVKGVLDSDEYERQAHRFQQERAELLEEAAELAELSHRVRPIRRDVWTLCRPSTCRGSGRCWLSPSTVLP